MIGAVTALFVVGEVAIYLPSLLGDAALHDTVGLPPMLLPVLWAVLGGVLWRAQRVVEPDVAVHVSG